MNEKENTCTYSQCFKLMKSFQLFLFQINSYSKSKNKFSETLRGKNKKRINYNFQFNSKN